MFSTSQNTSKTFNYAPSLGEITLNAFSRIQVRGTELTQTHMFQAVMEANNLLSEISNRQPNLWEVDLQTMPLTQGVATYSVPQPTVMILDLYIRTGSAPTNFIDRYIWPVSRTEYDSYSNKFAQGVPTVYWYDRLISQNVTFFPVPDGNGPYTALFHSVRQTQDATIANGMNVEVPYRWLEVFCSGLAWKLATHYAPQLEDKMFARYERQWGIAATQDTENVNMSIIPGLGNYYS